MLEHRLMVQSDQVARGVAANTGASPRPHTAKRLLCLVLHGVSPATWPLFRPLVRHLSDLGDVQANFLISPAGRAGESLMDDRRFCAAMDGRLLRGDELVLNGFGPPPGEAEETITRRPATWHGMPALETAPQPLFHREVLLRLRAGLRQFMDLDWPVEGFIAPGWHLGSAVRAALNSLPFRYTADRERLIRLENGRSLPTPAAVGSDLGAPWRTALARGSRSSGVKRLDDAPCVRLVVHPMDLRHRDGLSFWRRTLDRMLAERHSTTLSDWLGET
jgi:uncharacterized protein